jgi:hypothetical protein
VDDQIPALGFDEGDLFTFWTGGDEGRSEFVRCFGDPQVMELTVGRGVVDVADTVTLDIVTFRLIPTGRMAVVDSTHLERPVTGSFPDLPRDTGPTCGGVDFDQRPP